MSVLTASLLVACGNDNKSSTPPQERPDDNEVIGNTGTLTTVTLNASSYSDYVYYDLDTRAIVTESDDWDISFKRSSMFLNEGKESTLGDNQADMYDDEGPIAENIVNATADTEEGDFLALSTDSDLTYISSDVAPYLDTSDLYSYNGSTPPYDDHGFTAKTENNWVLTSAEGDTYAKMNVSSFDKSSPMAPYALVAAIDFYVETDTGFPVIATNTWALDFGSSAISCFDFDSGSVVDCSTDTWDVKADITSDGQNSAYKLYINGGDSGSGLAKAYGPVTTAEFDFTTGAPTMQNGLQFAYGSDYAGSAFLDSLWYAYDVLNEGTHFLWPTYKTYIINTDPSSDTDDTKFKLQILDYYNESNASGYPQIRFSEIYYDGE